MLMGASSLRAQGWQGFGVRETLRTVLAPCVGWGAGEKHPAPWGQHSLMLGWPETLRRMSTSFSVASRSSCTSSELKLPPPVMSMIFTAYSWHVGLWMQRRTTLLTPLGVQRTESPGGPSPGGGSGPGHR